MIQNISAASGLILLTVQANSTSVLAGIASDRPVIIISSFLGGTESNGGGRDYEISKTCQIVLPSN